MLRRMKGDAHWREAGPSNVPLPVYLGRGADAITGQWFQLSGEASGIATQHWFFQARQGGVFQAATTGKSISVESGSLWSLEDSALGARGVAQFLASDQPQFSRAAVPLEALNAAYAQEALTRLHDPRAALQSQDTDYRLGGTIRGKLLNASLIDPQAPAGFVAQESGRYNDPIYGPLDVNAGDVFIWMAPLAYQAKVAQVLEGAKAVLYRADGTVAGLGREESFNTPALGGLTLGADVPAPERARFPFPIAGSSIVQMGVGQNHAHARHAVLPAPLRRRVGELCGYAPETIA